MIDFAATMADNWPYWVVTLFVIVAAYIDGKELRVPNKLTYPMIIAGWIYSMIAYGMVRAGTLDSVGVLQVQRLVWLRYCLPMRSAAWVLAT